MKHLLLIIGLLITCATFAQFEETDSLSGYYINGKGVSQEKFDAFLESLEEVKGTWYCDDMEEGGQTGYDVKDDKGNVYAYYCLSHPTEGHCAISIYEKKKP